MNEKIWLYIGVGLIAYVAYRVFTSPSRKFEQELKKEMYEVLNNEEFKVKGRHD